MGKGNIFFNMKLMILALGLAGCNPSVSISQYVGNSLPTATPSTANGSFVVATPTPVSTTHTPTPTPAHTPTPTPTATPVHTPTPTPTATPVTTPTATPIATPTATPSFTANYYVSPSGADTNAGTSGAPFKTIQKAVTVATNGKVIGVRAGTYRELVTMTTAGVTLSAYPGETAIISGANALTGWSQYSGNIYSVHVGTNVNQVFVDGAFLPIARYPTSGYLTINATSANKTTVNSNALTSLGGSIVGANMHIRTTNWSWEDKVVSSLSSSVATLTASTAYTPTLGFGYYLENKLWMLTSAGQWVYDSTSGNLYVWTTDGTSPASHTVEASVRDGILVKASSIAINGLEIDKTATMGISLDWGLTPGTVSNITLNDSGGIGIYAHGVGNGLFTQNTLNNTHDDGIDVSYSTNTTVSFNTITNTGLDASPHDCNSGVNGGGTTGVTIKKNIVTNQAYNGITYGFGALVQNNVISNSLIRMVDGGGIYSYQGEASQDLFNSTVDGNIISGSVGSYAATPNTGGFPAAGLYMDEQTDGVTASNNIIFGNERGLFMGDNNHNTITGNLVYGNTTNQFEMQELAAVGSQNNQLVTDNTFIALNGNIPVTLHTSHSTISNFGTFNRNKFGTLYNTQVVTTGMEPGYPSDTTYANDQFNFAQWQSTGRESNGAIANPFSFASYIVNSAGSNLVTNGTFATNVANWAMQGTGAAMSWLSACGESTTGCMNVVTGSGDVGLDFSNGFLVQQGTTYQVKFDAMLSSGTANSIASYVQRNNSPYDNYSDAYNFAVDSQWRTNQYLFTAASTATSLSSAPRTAFYIPTSNTVRFDNVSVQAVTVTNETPSLDSKLLVNSTSATTSIACPDGVGNSRCSQYVGLDGQSVSFPLSLAAYTGKVVMWASSPYRQ